MTPDRTPDRSTDRSTGAAAVRAIGLARRYQSAAGQVNALDGADFEVASGEQVAVMGPSGSGKSTLLALIGGLDRPTDGTIEVLGSSVGTMSEAARTRFRRDNLGFIFQDYDLLPHFTAAENVSLGAAISDHHVEANPVDLLGHLGLDEGEANKLPDQLSGGQQQRVGIARCLAARPKLILADEPTGSLDSVTSATVVEVLSAQTRTLGAALIVVTHDPVVASQLDRIIWLRDGRVVTADGAAAVAGADHRA
jgi:putative ABC transport system ATP-binding protein